MGGMYAPSSRFVCRTHTHVTILYLLSRFAFSIWQSCSGGAIACPDDYADGSVQMACNYAYVEADGSTHVPNNFALGDPYYNRNIPIVYEQLAKGGVRLAAILNRIWPDD